MKELLFEKIRKRQRRTLTLQYIPIILFIAIILASAWYFSANDSASNTQKSDDEISQQEKESTQALFLESDIDQALGEHLRKLSDEGKLNVSINPSNSEQEALTTSYLGRNITEDKGYRLIWSKLYLPVVRVDSPLESLPIETLDQILNKQQYEGYQIIWTQQTDSFIRSRFLTGVGQRFTTHSQIEKELLSNENTIAIIPFEELNPNLKVLTIDTLNPLDKQFNKIVYPLTDTLWLKSEDSELLRELEEEVTSLLGEPNYDNNMISDLIVTGNSRVGARDLYLREVGGADPLLPLLGISSFLSQADIAHMNNETSFSKSCFQAGYSQVLCGTLTSFEGIKRAGIDVVGLNGDHILDYGLNEFRKTLDLYDGAQIRYFGAGTNLELAHRPALLDTGKVKVAFLGYNFNPPATYFATDIKPGTASPDSSLGDGARMKEDIKKAKESADIVLIDMNWGYESSAQITAAQTTYGEVAIASGADIINGVNSGVIQPVKLIDGKPLFYGLGGFVTDGIELEETREGILVRHLFYNRKHIGFQIVPVYLSDSYQIQLAEGAKRKSILDRVNSTISFE